MPARIKVKGDAPCVRARDRFGVLPEIKEKSPVVHVCRPHRLNAEERDLFDMGKRKGYVDVGGSAWRAERRDAPLVNTWRNWCDATAQPSLIVHKSSGTDADAVVLDLSPLRRSRHELQIVAEKCLALALPHAGAVSFDDGLPPAAEGAADDAEADSVEPFADDIEDWITRPVHQLPRCEVLWYAQRSEAKALAKQLAAALGSEDKNAASRKKAPNAKAGKSRRSGGYGI